MREQASFRCWIQFVAVRKVPRLPPPNAVRSRIIGVLKRFRRRRKISSSGRECENLLKNAAGVQSNTIKTTRGIPSFLLPPSSPSPSSLTSNFLVPVLILHDFTALQRLFNPPRKPHLLPFRDVDLSQSYAARTPSDSPYAHPILSNSILPDMLLQLVSQTPS
jgi:hypothetical protein